MAEYAISMPYSIWNTWGRGKTSNRQTTNENEDSVADSAFRSVPVELKPLFNDHRIALRARYSFDGVMFARSSTQVGNSLIVYYADQKTTNPIAGSIEYIVSRRDGSTSFIVRRQMPLDIGSIDPFSIYPQFPARLYSTKLSPQLEVITPTMVMSHYARWQVNEQEAVVVVLLRVSLIIYLLEARFKPLSQD